MYIFQYFETFLILKSIIKSLLEVLSFTHTYRTHVLPKTNLINVNS